MQTQVPAGSERERVFLIIHHENASLTRVVVFAEILHAPRSIRCAGYVAPLEVADQPSRFGHRFGEYGDAAYKLFFDRLNPQNATFESIARSAPEAFGGAILGKNEIQKIHRYPITNLHHLRNAGWGPTRQS